MKKFSVFVMILILGAAFSRLMAQEENADCSDQGKIHCMAKDACPLSFFDKASGIFCLQKGTAGYILAKWDLATAQVRESALTQAVNPYDITKIAVGKGVLYLLGKDAVGMKTLISVPVEAVNAEKVSLLPGIEDFTLLDDAPVLLIKNKEEYSLQNDLVSVPLSLKGACSIGESTARRLIVATNGAESELVDMVIGKSLYLFSSLKELVQPGDFNVLVKALDSPPGGSGSEETVFYKLYVDGIFTGRTDTAPAAVEKAYSLKTAADKHHLFRLERWELDKKSEQYKRSNNIKQPGGIRIYIPAGRIIVIDLVYDGKDNKVTHYPLYK